MEEVGGVGDIGSEDTTAIHVLLLLEACLKLSLRSVCFID